MGLARSSLGTNSQRFISLKFRGVGSVRKECSRESGWDYGMGRLLIKFRLCRLVLNFSLHPHVHTNTHKYDWIVHQPKTSIILSTHCFGLHAGHLWFLRGNSLQSNNMHPHTHIYIHRCIFTLFIYNWIVRSSAKNKLSAKVFGLRARHLHRRLLWGHDLSQI